jgi:hypothetical protein
MTTILSTPTTLTITSAAKGDANADWLARATAPGVTFAYDMGDTAWWSGAWRPFSFNAHKFADSLNPTYLAQIVPDTTDGPNGRCMRIDYPAAQGNTSAALVLPLNGAWTSYTQGMGNNAFYIQFRFKIPPSRLELINASGIRAWKWLNVAGYDPQNITGHSPSNMLCEHVLEDTYQRGFPAAYHRDTAGTFPPFDERYGSYDFKFQNMIDNGSGLPDAQRYCLYSTASQGYPGCLKWTTNEWVTFKLRIRVGTYAGSAGNEFDLWYARKDATQWSHLISSRNHDVGPPDAGFAGGLNGAHLHGYSTGRISAPSDTWMRWAQFIVSMNDIPLPAPGA